MTQSELFNLLKTTGYPLAYHHFTVSKNNPMPSPPYMVYARIFDNNISSDAKVHGKFKYYQIELYTAKKDLVAEQKVETVLEGMDSEYETDETYLETEKLYQVVYQIKIIERR